MVAPSIGRALVRGLSAELGFALPMTILVLAMMTVMLTAAFTRVSADRRIADGTEATVTALAIAQAGLQTYLSVQDSEPPNGDSVRINVMGGYAWVVPHIIQDPTGVPVLKTFVVRSTGYLIAPTAGPDPLAERTVAQFAVWEPGSIRQLGAVTAFGSDPAVNDHGGVDPFWVFGADDCGEEVAVPGVRTYTTSGLSSTNPDDGPRNNLVTGTRAEIAAETGIDWDAIVNDGALQPDYTSLVPNDTTFKTYFIDAGEVDAENFKGTGLLVITGELDTGNSSSHGYFVWDGIVLLGGALDADAMDSTVINGLLITGLNTLTGESAPTTVFDNNPVHVRYNSCNVSRALERWKGFRPLPGAWVDTWATY
jgi:type II secretory pathway pseudopilin PulG